MDVAACFLLFLTPSSLSDFGVFSSGVLGTVVSGVWLEVLSTDCPGCDEVAVGVPCPHGIELPGEDSWLCGV